MMIRILLVGLVASLGLELPKGDDVTRWADSGRAWASIRLAELNQVKAEACQTLASLAEFETTAEPATPTIEPATPAATADAAFEIASEQIACDFVADLAVTTPTTPVETSIALIEANVTEVNAGDSGDVCEDDAEIATLAEATPARSDRLNQAVRATANAVNAWVSVFQASDGVEATH